MKKIDLKQFNDSIVQFYEKLFSWEQEVAKNSGFSIQQIHVIGIVGGSGIVRMKPLAEKLGITTGSLTVMINRLEKSGFVSREKDPDDGRGFNIFLTEKGEIIHEEHHSYHLKLAQEIVGSLEPGETEVFLTTLNKIIKNI
jgi:DNA-binding MarR family transcriptional regulator